jgi:hypothetical protein
MIKVCVWHFILFSFANYVHSQNNIPTTKATTNGLRNEHLDLEKIIWSYSHYKTVKNEKAKIDFDAVDNWQGIGTYLSISNNGKFFAYTVEKGVGLPDEYRKLDSVIVKSTSSSWCRSFAKASPGFFTSDNKQYVFQNNDTLCLLQLGTKKYKTINNVESYRISEQRNDWMAYKYKNKKSVILRNLLTEKQKQFSDVATFSFDKSRKWFVCQLNTPLNELRIYNLNTDSELTFSSVKSYLFSLDGNSLLINSGNVFKYFNSLEHKVITIWTTKDTSTVLSAYQFDKSGTQVVFTVKDMSSVIPKNSIWYYRQGMERAILKGNDETLSIPGDLKIQESVSFTDNSNYIHLILQRKPEISHAMNDGVQVDVWSYKDMTLQNRQQFLSKQYKIFNAFINIETGHIIILENGKDKTLFLLHGDFAIVMNTFTETHGDRFWEKGLDFNEDSSWVVSLKDGSRHLLHTSNSYEHFWFSPGGNYLVYFDALKTCHYFSYNLQTRKLEDISPDFPSGQLGYIKGYPFSISDEKPDGPFGLAAWLQNDAGLLVYGNNDIWKLDLIGRQSSVNVTNDFGRKNNIVFSLFNSHRFGFEVPILNEKESLVLRAFNNSNKCSGFYRKTAPFIGDPELLAMGPYFTQIIPWGQDPNLSKTGLRPVKARDAAVWILQRQSSTDAPNYYKTIDFKSFTRLTDFQPHKKYDWLTEELHSFKHLDGRTGQAILYKPENFDSLIKYPVLIIFYGEYSNNLHQFPIPAYNNDAITPGQSPNWFLNNGYIIFTPDIYVEPLKCGPEAFNVIEGAARYLKQLPYVDSNKLSFCAHSWSAKLGSYIFTHSKSFAAIGISEGFLYANMINVALSTDDNEISKLESVENDFQYGSLWENKDLWLDQTTVLNVDKAKSPLLLLCNKESTKEYQNQTLQLFTALRRLDKKVWWLKYDKGGHLLMDLNEEKDFTIRYTQFFDHYLKDAPAPCWMTQGIPFRLKGIESRYEFDPAGNCGKGCKICEKWNQQYRKYPEMFGKDVSEWHLTED